MQECKKNPTISWLIKEPMV
jgi:hypothetical protein